MEEVAFGSHAYHQACTLRERILRQPLGLPLRQCDTQHDAQHIHLIARDADIIVATVILRPVDNVTAALRQMAVCDTMQKQGIGKQLLGAAEDTALKRGWRNLYMHARLHAQPFYSKLGYRPIGEVFTEIGILHIMMQKNLSTT